MGLEGTRLWRLCSTSLQIMLSYCKSQGKVLNSDFTVVGMQNNFTDISGVCQCTLMAVQNEALLFILSK